MRVRLNGARARRRRPLLPPKSTGRIPRDSDPPHPPPRPESDAPHDRTHPHPPGPAPRGTTSLESDALDVADALVGLHGGYAIVAGTDPTTNTRLCAAITDAVLSARIGFLADFGYEVGKFFGYWAEPVNAIETAAVSIY